MGLDLINTRPPPTSAFLPLAPPMCDAKVPVDWEGGRVGGDAFFLPLFSRAGEKEGGRSFLDTKQSPHPPCLLSLTHPPSPHSCQLPSGTGKTLLPLSFLLSLCSHLLPPPPPPPLGAQHTHTRRRHTTRKGQGTTESANTGWREGEGEDEDSMSHGRLDEKEKEEEGDLEDFLPPESTGGNSSFGKRARSNPPPFAAATVKLEAKSHLSILPLPHFARLPSLSSSSPFFSVVRRRRRQKRVSLSASWHRIRSRSAALIYSGSALTLFPFLLLFLPPCSSQNQ